jgi:hypothetical protein
MAALLDCLTLDQAIASPRSAVSAGATLTHDIAGSLRLVVPVRKDEPHRAAVLRVRLDGLDAACAEQSNTLVSNVLVEYDAAAAGQGTVVLVLDDAGYRLTQRRSQPPVAGLAASCKAQRTAPTAGFRRVLDPVLESAIVTFI